MPMAVVTGCAVVGCPGEPRWLVQGWLRVGKTGIDRQALMASCDTHLIDFGIEGAIGDALVAGGQGYPPSRWESQLGTGPIPIRPIISTP